MAMQATRHDRKSELAESSGEQGEFLFYQAEDAKTRVQVRFQDGGVWLAQTQLAELYQGTSRNLLRVPMTSLLRARNPHGLACPSRFLRAVRLVLDPLATVSRGSHQCSPQNISHLRAIFESGELLEQATCKPYLHVRLEHEPRERRRGKHCKLGLGCNVHGYSTGAEA